MKIYTIKINESEMYNFIRFLMKYKINLYFTWQNEELFEFEFFATIVSLDQQAKEAIEGNYRNNITQSENI